MSLCLTLYDVTGIQNFIFASNKTKENIGASIYVQNIFEKELVECIKELEDVEIDWKGSREIKINLNSSLKAEIVYIGGGNAMVLFDSQETAKRITKALSEKILKDTQATLAIVVAYQDTNFKNFEKDRELLFKTLNKNKEVFVKSTPLRGISITRECDDGLPSSGKKDRNVFISNVADTKRTLTSEFGGEFLNLLPENSVFPLEFDKLGKKEGESHIAVVHIDGNSMGRFIDERLAGKTNYIDAISVMRELSFKMQQLYKGVFKKMLFSFRDAVENENVRKHLDFENGILPIRPIILNGDDVTFVCDGRIGIQLANLFLRLLHKTFLELHNEKYRMSACAGVAIVKSHFPFFRAYKLAEQLCDSAKKKAKFFDKENPGCWIDYHIVYSGFNLDLDQARIEQYNVPGMKIPTEKKSFPKHNLLLRPFCVSGETTSVYQWSKIEALYNEMKKIPRSRLKDLRNAFISSKEDVDFYQKKNSSRGYILPKFEIENNLFYSSDNLFRNNQTPYFEPLELLDFYISDLKLANGGE